jgi:phospholipase A1
MKKFIIFLITVLVLCSSSLFAVDTIQSSKPTYFITGDNQNQTKFQINIDFALIYPFETGLFLSYTQVAKWNIYDQSSPFKDINHNPSIFWQKNNLGYFDFIRIIPYSHKSNGRDGDASRGIDRYFIEAQISYNLFSWLNIGMREKAGGFYAISNKNHDIKRYIGYFETEGFIQVKDKLGYFEHERLYAKGEWTHKFYWLECGLTIRIFSDKIRPDFYIQWYKGYGEFLLNYNKYTNAVRAGIIFNI